MSYKPFSKQKDSKVPFAQTFQKRLKYCTVNIDDIIIFSFENGISAPEIEKNIAKCKFILKLIWLIECCQLSLIYSKPTDYL